MVLSKISVFVTIIEEDCPMGEAIGTNFGMVSRTFSLIFPIFFPEGTSRR